MTEAEQLVQEAGEKCAAAMSQFLGQTLPSGELVSEFLERSKKALLAELNQAGASAVSVTRTKLPRKLKKRWKKEGRFAVTVSYQPPPLRFITATIGFAP